MTTVAGDDRVAATLSEIRESHRQHVSMSYPEPGICVSRDGRWPCDSARLLAAVEAALALADEWKQIPFAVRASDECADELRAAITAALTGAPENDSAPTAAVREEMPPDVCPKCGTASCLEDKALDF